MSAQERLASAVVPVARAIPWRPVTHSNHLVVPLLRPERSHFRHFVTQRALIAAQELARGASGEEPSSGLLTGRLHRCPRTRARWALVEELSILDGDPGGAIDSTRTGWMRQHVEAAEGKGRPVIGWACGRPTIRHRLSAADESLHLRCFQRPYQVALVAGEGVGGLYAWEAKVACTFLLPFHELLDHEIDEGADVPPATVMDWVNYEPGLPVIGVRPAERVRLSGSQPVIAPPATGFFGSALESLRGLVGGSGT